MLRQATAAFAVVSLLISFQSAGAATTCNSVAACLLGNNTGRGVGLEGVSPQNVGVYGVSGANHGVDGRSRSSYGVVGYTYFVSPDYSGATAGVYGIDSGSGQVNSGVFGQSTDGFGVTGMGQVGVRAFGSIAGLLAYGESAITANGSGTTLTLSTGSGGLLLLGVSGEGGTPIVTIDANGNAIFAGTVTQSGTPFFRTKTKGSDVASYGARTASPTLEDFGTAQLRNGAASVALDATFASAIDTSNFMVFITPHGNSNGLYTQTSPSGFDVRENNGGRSTLAFDYRIVAKPFDAHATHLPALAPFKGPARSRASTLRARLP